MAYFGKTVFFLLTMATSAQAAGCGLTKESVPYGTPIQQISVYPGQDWRINFSQARTRVVSAQVIRPACHGRSIATRPVGFRYIPDRAFRGYDSMLVKACNGMGQCSHTGFIMMVN